MAGGERPKESARNADTRRLYRETNEGNEGDTAGAPETIIKSQDGDRQSTWEHMAPTNNKPCAQHTETSGGQPGHTSRTVTASVSAVSASIYLLKSPPSS